MGMYTELFVTARIKKGTEATEILKKMLGDESIILLPDFLPTHPLFSTPRWEYMLTCSSHYFTPTNVGTYDEQPHYTTYDAFVSYSSFKNYDNEVAHFFDWLKPHIDDVPGTLIGFYRYEEDTEPTLVYL